MVREKSTERSVACDLCGKNMLTEFPLVVGLFRYRFCRRCFNAITIHDRELTS